MKKVLFFMGCLVAGVSYGQVVHIPDPVFKAQLVSNPQINTNGDNEIQQSEAIAFSGGIFCPQNAGISDVTGLQSFVNLKYFGCERNSLTSIDLTKNTELREVSIYFNKIQSIDLSQNTKLEYLDLGDNLLTSVDLFYNIKLSELYCSNNRLESLNLKSSVSRNLYTMIADKNPNLSCILVDDVALANNYTSSGDWEKDDTASYNTICNSAVYIPDANFKAYLVGNPVINTNGDNEISPDEAEAFTGNIECSGKNIANLRGIETFTNIKQLDVHNNQLKGLDISNNIALESLLANQNLLIDLNLKNGHNTQLSVLNVLDNPDLYCIKVDDIAFANSNNNWQKDSTASFSESCNVYIPNANFKNYLLGRSEINTNQDSEISVLEAKSFTGKIDLYSRNVSDLTGLEAFVNLKELTVHYNPVSSIDLSANKELVYLYLSNNQLTTIDLSANTNLESAILSNNQLTNVILPDSQLLKLVELGYNKLTNLDVSKSGGLEKLYVYRNQLTEIDLSKNLSLNTLELNFNLLTNINLNKNLFLTDINADSNKLSTIDLTKNSALKKLSLNNNQITALDFGSNTQLEMLSCNQNPLLKSLNLRNGNIQKLQTMYADENPNLFCIQVDDVDLANSKPFWAKDATANYSENCGFPVYIPDVNFKAYLVANAQINTDSDSEISYAEAGAYQGVIEVSNKDISNLKGIEAFENIIKLEVQNNNLTSLHISKNIKLQTLIADQNQLTELNLKNGNNTDLTSMSVLSNPELSCIEVDDLDLANTYTSSSAWKKDSTANYSENCNPSVHIPDANFKAYLVSNPNINTNGDNEISFSEARSYLGDIQLVFNNGPSRMNGRVADLTGIEAFVNIIALHVQGHNLTTIDISQNKLLKGLMLADNQLTSIDVSNNTQLEALILDGNKLTNVDASKNTELYGISVVNNELLTNLNVKNGNNEALTYMWANNTPELTCIQVDNPALSNTYPEWRKDATASYNENCGPVMATADARKKAISIYPNPVKNVLNFAGQDKINKVIVISIDGKKITEKNMNGEKTLNVQTLTQGIYFIQIFTDKGVQTTKFIKN